MFIFWTQKNPRSHAQVPGSFLRDRGRRTHERLVDGFAVQGERTGQAMAQIASAFENKKESRMCVCGMLVSVFQERSTMREREESCSRGI
jgi:hypothetical protein